jgi:hypothetical protein
MIACGVRIRAWLLLPALILVAADVFLTLAGQSVEYWAGDCGAAIEANPLAYPFLAAHPALFVGVAFLWGGVVAGVVLCWPHPFVLWLPLAVAFGHAVAGSTWLARFGELGWAGAVLYLVIAAGFTQWCWQRAMWLAAACRQEKACGSRPR